MPEPERKRIGVDIYDDAELMASIGGHPGEGLLALMRSAAFHIRHPRTHLPEVKKHINPVTFVKDFRDHTHFQEIDEDLVVTEDIVNFIRVVDGKEVTYMESLERGRKNGPNEAVSYGVGQIKKHDFVGIMFNWDFMGASVGDVAAEKIVRAFDLARKGNRPVVILYTSGGQRQQEAAAALWGMDKVVLAMNQYQDQTDKPVTGVVINDTTGGATASGLPRCDIIAGMGGSVIGFAGKRVIEGNTSEKVEEGAQSVENSYLTNKIVQVILQDGVELHGFLEGVFDTTFREKVQKGKKPRPMNGFDFEGEGFKTPFMPKKASTLERSEIRVLPEAEATIGKTIYEQYKVLASDPKRPDFLYLLQNAFDAYVPLFTGRVIPNEDGSVKLEYPAIAYAFAAIEDPRLAKTLWLMTVGNQPGYLRNEDGIIMKDHASPNAWDYRRQAKMMHTGQRMGLPMVSFIDNFGASPSLAQELAGLYGSMSDAYADKLSYKYLAWTYVLGMFGSGGAGASSFWDKRVMLSGAQIYVAPPKAAANIVYKEPTPEDVVRTAETMRPDARFLWKTGQINGVIEEPAEGAGNNPLATALAIREDIITTYLDLGKYTPEELITRRNEIIRGTRPIPMGHLNGGASSSHHEFFLKKWLSHR